MPNRNPTPRKLRKLEEKSSESLDLHPHHPQKTGIKVPPVKVYEAPKFTPRTDLSVKSRSQTPRELTLLIAITTYKRPQHLCRLLRSLQENTKAEFRANIEVLIVDDGSSKEDLTKITEEIKSFSKGTGCLVSLWAASERVGRGRNKNRALYFFKEMTPHGEILLIDDDSLFLHPDWWSRLRDVVDKTKLGLLGFIPAYLNVKTQVTIVSPDHLKTLNTDPGISTAHSTNYACTQILYLNRESVTQLGYLDCVEGHFSTELEEYCKRWNRLSKRQVEDYLIVPNTSRSISTCNDISEDWASGEQKRSLKEDLKVELRRRHLKYKEASSQRNRDSGLKKLIDEASTITRFSAEGATFLVGGLSSSLKKKISHLEFKDPPLENGTLTVIIGHRGLERLPNLLHTIDSLNKSINRPQIIVVEQDTFPLCRDSIESKVTKYVFTYSNRPYNRGWAFNVGVKLSNSENVLLHDNDLIVPEDYTISVVNMLKNAQAAICWGRISYLTPEYTESYPEGRKRVLRTISNEGIHGGSTVVKRDFYNEIGGFDERFEGWGAEDDAFYEKARKLGKLVRVNPKKGPWLSHLYHTHGKFKHQHWGRNKTLWIQYCSGTVLTIRGLIKEAGEWGDPNKCLKNTPQSLQHPTTSSKEMYHLHVIYDVPGWAYWHRSEALRKNAPPNWTVSTGPDLSRNFKESKPDLVLLLNYGIADRVSRFLKRQSPNTLLVGSLNVGWPRRIEYLLQLREKCNHVIINNRDMFLKCGSIPGTSTISNGVDLDVFYPQKSHNLPITRNPKLLWTGSKFHATLKGWSILKKLEPQINMRGMSLDLRLVDSHGKVYNHSEMSNWYNTGNCYIVASESEGTPNPALEAAACGIPIIATKVGNMPELIEHKINGFLLEDREPSSILEGIQYVVENSERLSNSILQSIQPWGWKTRASKYFELFEMLLKGEIPSPLWNIPTRSVEELGNSNNSERTNLKVL